MDNVYSGLIALLDKLGFFNIVLPWILVYSLVYGILVKTQIFGNPFDSRNKTAAKTARNICSMVAFSMATIFIGAVNVTTAVRDLIPLIIIYILIIFSVILVLAAFKLIAPQSGGGSDQSSTEKVLYAMGIIATVLLIIIILNYFGISMGGEGGGATSWIEEYGEYIKAVGIIAMFGFIAWLISRAPSQTRREGDNRNL